MRARALLFAVFIVSICFADSIDVRLVTDEADAVLRILSTKQPTEKDWQRLFSSEGYVRLKKREESMKRSFTDDEFKQFVLSQDLSQHAADLAKTLEGWKQADMQHVGAAALAYLPAGAKIHAKIYPVIKPKTNSFVFEADTDPAIFLYLDPAESKEKFENTLTHELHHIGYSNVCTRDDTDRPKEVQAARQWMSGFGEGLAMLAAAGGPDIHPHATSGAEDRARWDHDVANFNSDLKTLEKFFLDILNHKISDQEIQGKGFSFFGIQGPWYTVGWKMAVTIEKTFGREKLLNSICDPAKFLAT